ncbi:MAG: hypothetical protein ABSG74_06275 [Candidatus Bathyarchaeia archaeon]|jgi:hypothetical protein
MRGKLEAHVLGFCKSVKLSLAIVKGKQDWQPVYFLAEYDYLPPVSSFKTLFRSPEFCVISSRVQMIQCQGFMERVRKGGKFVVSLEEGETLTIVFAGWNALAPVFVTGLESRQAWNRSWPHLQIDFHGGANEIESGLWEIIQNAVVTYEVPYSTVSEAVSDILKIKEERLEFKSTRAVHGSVLIPLFVSFESAKYDRARDKFHLVAKILHHSRIDSERLFVSARVEGREGRIEKLRKTQLPATRIVGPEKDLHRSEWWSPVETPATSVRHTTFYLVYEGIGDLSLLVDEEHLRSVPVLTAKSEIERLMTERSNRRELDYLTKIEKQLLDAKGEQFEEAVFMLLSRMGFDVAWENKNHSFDVLAASPNGCLVVECTSDPPSVRMAEELRNEAQSYENEKNPRVLAVLATNQTMWNELESDLDLVKMEREHGQVYFLTRDRLKRALEELKSESLARSERYLRSFEW